MAVRWMRNGLAAPAAIARVSRSRLASVTLLSIRHASAMAAEEVHRKPRSSPEVQVSSETSLPAETRAVGTDQPEFSTLEGRVSKRTLDVIIGEPMKLKHMSVVQAAVLPLLPDLAQPYDPEGSKGPRDLLVKARTGTGKTLAFLVPAIEARLKALQAQSQKAVDDSGLGRDRRLEKHARWGGARDEVGTLIISPTRELATQIAHEASKLSSRHNGFEVKLFVGGVSKGYQMRDWMRSNSRDIVVGTPGRLRDVLESEPAVRNALGKAKMLILDEADTLLEMGFRQEIEAIAEFLPPSPERQTFMFSATVSRAIQQIAKEVLDKNHVFINCVSKDSSPVHAHVPQYHTVLPSAKEQLPHVLRLLAHDQLSNPGKSKTIVFLPTTKMTQLYSTFLREMAKTLPAKRSRVYEIHSGRTQVQRTRTSDQFRADTSGSAILVSSDVSARGVDYPGVTRVIQVGIPSNTDQYVHRVGRTGRGKEATGRADLVLLPFEQGFVTWQLTDMPLKPLSVGELASQVNTLVEKYVADPKAFLRDSKFPGSAGHAPFQEDLTTCLTNIEKDISYLLRHVDEEAVKETFTTLLGYYVSKANDMRTSKSVPLDGLRAWTVEACGLEQPPHLSSFFLEKIGMPKPKFSQSSGRQSSGGRRWSNDENDKNFARRDKTYRQSTDQSDDQSSSYRQMNRGRSESSGYRQSNRGYSESTGYRQSSRGNSESRRPHWEGRGRNNSQRPQFGGRQSREEI